MPARAKSKRKSLKAKDLSARREQAGKVKGGGVGPCFGKIKEK